MTAQLTHEPAPTGPIVCAPWCRDFDGHADVLFAADQVCMSPEETVNLSLHPLVAMNDGTSVADTAVVLLQRHPQTATHIAVELGRDASPLYRLTPTEARALISALQAAVTEEGLSA